jgi:hypothetical protein
MRLPFPTSCYLLQKLKPFFGILKKDPFLTHVLTCRKRSVPSNLGRKQRPRLEKADRSRYQTNVFRDLLHVLGISAQPNWNASELTVPHRWLSKPTKTRRQRANRQKGRQGRASSLTCNLDKSKLRLNFGGWPSLVVLNQTRWYRHVPSRCITGCRNDSPVVPRH